MTHDAPLARTEETTMVEYDPYSPEALEDPLPIYARLRDEAPCYWVEKRGCWALRRDWCGDRRGARRRVQH